MRRIKLESNTVPLNFDPLHFLYHSSSPVGSESFVFRHDWFIAYGLDGLTHRASCESPPAPDPLVAQFIEQRLSLLQVGGVEAFGEPAIDFGEHRARLVATAHLRKQSCQT